MKPAARRPTSIRRRVALLVGFGALAPMLVALATMRSAFEDVSVHPYCPETRRRGSCGLAGVIIQHATKA
jgi:hypothetical protein